MQNIQQTARVGLFFLLGMALIWVTFETLSGGKLWFKDKGYQIIAGFDSLKELKEGDEVRMAGVRIGEVAKTRLAGRRAEAVLRIDSAQKIKDDATAMIVTTGLIGTGYISIDLGTDAALYLREGAEIRTRNTPDLNAVMAQIGDLGKKIEGALGSLGTALSGDGKSPGLIQKIEGMLTENRDRLNRTTTNLQQITDKVNKGDGTLGKLLNDSKLHDDLVAGIAEIKSGAAQARSFIANAQTVLDEVKAGKGPLSTLVFDQKAGDDLRASIASLRSLSDKIARGEGTLGKLISDDSLLRDAKSLMKKADRALEGFDDSGPITAVGVLYKGLF
jgi:phospholipid/cholesterol/gamma-HCH transport system substrate-binding protein